MKIVFIIVFTFFIAVIQLRKFLEWVFLYCNELCVPRAMYLRNLWVSKTAQLFGWPVVKGWKQAWRQLTWGCGRGWSERYCCVVHWNTELASPGYCAFVNHWAYNTWNGEPTSHWNYTHGVVNCVNLQPLSLQPLSLHISGVVNCVIVLAATKLATLGVVNPGSH